MLSNNRFGGYQNVPTEGPCELVHYVWPGGYEVFYVTADGDVLCCICAQAQVDRNLDTSAESTKTEWRFEDFDSSDRIIGHSHTGEVDSCETCAECNRIVRVCGTDDEDHSEHCDMYVEPCNLHGEVGCNAPECIGVLLSEVRSAELWGGTE